MSPLPRVGEATREQVARRIDTAGPEAFTRDSVEELERHNPELLQMAHAFAARHDESLRIGQGFALLHACLVAQAVADRAYLQ